MARGPSPSLQASKPPAELEKLAKAEKLKENAAAMIKALERAGLC